MIRSSGSAQSFRDRVNYRYTPWVRDESGNQTPNGRLLVVDDEPNVTAIVEEYFTSLGYAVDVAHDGGAALIQAAAVRPDVVLLDISMPEVSGEEVLDRLHALDPTVPIVMITGNADEGLAR